MVFTETKYAADVQMVRIDCCTCGIVYWVPKAWDADKRDTKDTFYCPNGHRQVYRKSAADIAKEEAKRLADQLASVRAMNDQLTARAGELTKDRDRIARRLSAQQGATKRIKRRVGKGTCPCCGVGFPNLRAHMMENHPEFKHDLTITEPKA